MSFRRISRQGSNLVTAALSLLIVLVVLAFLIRLAARIPISGVQNTVRGVATYADPGNAATAL